MLEAGYRVGTYTSPYILRFNERMKMNGVDIPDETLAELTDFIRPHAEAMEDKPTEFELITAIAMEYFVREKSDIVVLECGMGGRLDSTNVIQTPLLSVITGISLDHTAFLGDTVEKIAFEKAGIIKKDIPILYCGKDPIAKEVISSRAASLSAPFYQVDRSSFRLLSADQEGSDFSYGSYEKLHIPLLGTYQPENAQNVLTALQLLQKGGIVIGEDAVRRGLESVRWPARFERIRKDPVIICDGGHNPEGIDCAVDSAKLYFPTQKLLLVCGVMADKDYPYMVKKLSEIAKEAHCLKPQNPRALAAEDMAAEFRKHGTHAIPYTACEDALQDAVCKAKKENLPILCVGSLYFYGEVVAALEKLGL